MAVASVDLAAAPTDDEWRSALRCIRNGIGLIICLGIYGVLQERVMAVPYDDGHQEFFNTSVFLVMNGRLMAILYALLMIKVKGEDLGNKAPLWTYLAVSVSNVTATWSQYEALKYVSFPVSLLGKSMKMMPVMFWGILIMRTSYACVDWLIAAGVSFGVMQFMLLGTIEPQHRNEGSTFYGILLLLLFLGTDGFTSTFQERLFKEHKTSKFNQMLYINAGSAVVSISVLVVSGGLPVAIRFCRAHPAFNGHAVILAMSQVGGQYFIYSQVKEFGALVLAATLNTRQVVSIAMSYLIHLHPITIGQFAGLVIVFGSLFYKSLLGFRRSRERRTQLKEATPGAQRTRRNSASGDEVTDLVKRPDSGPESPLPEDCSSNRAAIIGRVSASDLEEQGVLRIAEEEEDKLAEDIVSDASPTQITTPR